MPRSGGHALPAVNLHAPSLRPHDHSVAIHSTQYVQAYGFPDGINAMAAVFEQDLRFLQQCFSEPGLLPPALLAGAKASIDGGLVKWLPAVQVSTVFGRCLVFLQCRR